MSHLIDLDNVGKFYGNIIALQGVTTHVNAGEVTCVLGDNGAGKSTFIKIPNSDALAVMWSMTPPTLTS